MLDDMAYRPRLKLQPYSYVIADSSAFTIKVGDQSIAIIVIDDPNGCRYELHFDTTRTPLTVHQLHVMADWLKDKVEEHLKGVNDCES